MNTILWRETVGLARDAIRANPSRSILTLLSVTIGVASILFCISAGTSLANFIEAELSSLGTDLMWVKPRVDTTDATMRREPLTFEDAVALAGMPGVQAVAPRASRSAVFLHEGRHLSGELLAVSSSYFTLRKKSLAAGRALLPSDIEHRRSVCVVGPGVVDGLLFRTSQPLGRSISIDGRPCVVVGVVARSEASLKTPGLEEENAVFVPVTTGARQFGLRELDFLFFQPAPGESIPALRQRIHQLLLLRQGARAAYDIDSLEERMRQVENLIWLAVVVFGSIAAIALVVAGIGIMNIMLLSVIERTREIGIRKSVGARKRHILIQFFSEAVLLSGGGGALGVAVGIAATLVLSWVTSGVVSVSWSAAAIALAFSVSTGVFFGIYPALRAAALPPIVALAREAS